MQQPTLTDVHIRSAADAHKLFYAVQLGMLSKIEKRLDAHERSALRPGDVYVWEEKGPSADSFSVSMERFTEGKSWTASRVREDFLMYFENQHKPKGRGGSQKAKSSENQVVRPGENDQFIKQTYSVYRDDPDDMGRPDSNEEAQKKPRKWHLNAYFTKLTEGQLRTIDDIPILRDLAVPEGIFKSAKTSKGGKKGDNHKTSTSSVKRTFAPFPSNYRAHRQQPLLDSPPVASTSSIPAQPYATNTEDRTLQRIIPVTIAPLQQQPVLHQPMPPHNNNYSLLDPSQNMFDPHSVSPYADFQHSTYSFDAEYLPAPPHTRGPASGSDNTSPSPLLSDSSLSSWRSSPGAGSPRKMSVSPSLSNVSASPVSHMADAFPLTDDGLPYQPAPVAGAGPHLVGPARDLAPLNSLRRSHPYRRSAADDRALRLLARAERRAVV